MLEAFRSCSPDRGELLSLSPDRGELLSLLAALAELPVAGNRYNRMCADPRFSGGSSYKLLQLAQSKLRSSSGN